MTSLTFLLVSPSDAVAIAAINAANPTDGRQLSPVRLADGRWVLPADLLTDCGESGTWSLYGDLLRGLAAVDLTTSDFPVVEMEVS